MATNGRAEAEPGPGHDPTRIADFSFGIFCPAGGTYRTEAGNTIRGDVTRHDQTPLLVVKTQTIPAIDGITFGVQGREAPESMDDVTITVDHPPLGADGVISESWTTQMEAQRITFHGYFLGLSDGNPQGVWTITGSRDGQDLFRAQFNVVPVEAEDPSEQDPCLTMLVS